MRTFAIGDIHGCLMALRVLDDHLRFGAEDTVITLGDYVDRGPDSCGVIEYLLALRQRTRLIPLLGNHEIMMQQARQDARALMGWLINGGDATLESYNAQSHSQAMDAIPQEHWQFLEGTVRYYETESGRDFFVHANVHPKKPLDQQDDNTLFWQHLQAGKQTAHVSGRRMICGHTSQKNGRVLEIGRSGHTICIDTWACGGQWLTCLNPDTNEYWQANEAGQLRRGMLGAK